MSTFKQFLTESNNSDTVIAAFKNEEGGQVELVKTPHNFKIFVMAPDGTVVSESNEKKIDQALIRLKQILVSEEREGVLYPIRLK